MCFYKSEGLLLICVLFIFLLFGCRSADRKNEVAAKSKRTSCLFTDSLKKGEELFNTYCNTCHMLPDPGRLPDKIWEKGVMPLMAIRMGIQKLDYVRQISPEELKIEQEHNIIPETPMVKESDFNLIMKYILNSAPETLHYDSSRLGRNNILTQFNRKNIVLKNSPSYITAIKFNELSNILWIADLENRVFQWSWGKGILSEEKVYSPVSDFTFLDSVTFLTQIGSLAPSELSLGILSESGKAPAIILKNLHRPVFTLMEDLDTDSIPEIIVGNFGKNTGSLSLYQKSSRSNIYNEMKLISSPGVVKCYIKDMNGDGRKDIIALFAQADERIIIFYQRSSLEFVPEQILRFPPDYGTTDMVLTDFNKDGLTDIITANGDNADYSIVLKDYHGIRIHLNQGNNMFRQEYFYPVYGATRLLAEDFDKDGDIDFSINSFYADYGPLNKEAFVYLETVDADKMKFNSFIHLTELPVNSLTMEKADIDNDGDMDIILGNFAASPIRVPKYLEEQWKTAKYGLVIYQNNLY